MKRPLMVAMDLEGVLIPEVWIAFAEKTGIDELRLTTRDISDYDVLMRGRLRILKEHGLKLRDIQEVIETMQPFEGAREYLDWLREQNFQAVILSDAPLDEAALTAVINETGYQATGCVTRPATEKKALFGLFRKKA